MQPRSILTPPPPFPPPPPRSDVTTCASFSSFLILVNVFFGIRALLMVLWLGLARIMKVLGLRVKGSKVHDV